MTSAKAELLKHGKVRRRPFKTFKLSRSAPKDLFVFERIRHAPHDMTKIRQEPYRPALVSPLHGIKRFIHQDINAELLAQFTDKRFFRGLTRLHLASWKLPQSAEVFVRRSPAGQKAARIILDNSAHHIRHRRRTW